MDLGVGPRISLKDILWSAEDAISELPGELAGRIRKCDDISRGLHRHLRLRAEVRMRLRGKGGIALRKERVLVHDQHLLEAKLLRFWKGAEDTQVLNGSSRAASNLRQQPGDNLQRAHRRRYQPALQHELRRRQYGAVTRIQDRVQH